MTSYAYYHLTSKVRHHLTQDACAKVTYATITTRLDYHKGLLLGLSDNTRRGGGGGFVQRVQNNSARLLTDTRHSEHTTHELQHLHWLPVKHTLVCNIKCLLSKRPSIQSRQQRT